MCFLGRQSWEWHRFVYQHYSSISVEHHSTGTENKTSPALLKRHFISSLQMQFFMSSIVKMLQTKTCHNTNSSRRECAMNISRCYKFLSLSPDGRDPHSLPVLFICFSQDTIWLENFYECNLHNYPPISEYSTSHSPLPSLTH